MKFKKSTSAAFECVQYQAWIPVSKNKQIELSFIYTKKEWSWFEFLISWTRRKDNAGFSIYLEILMIAFRVSIADKRLWDHDKNNWEQECPQQTTIKYEWF